MNMDRQMLEGKVAIVTGQATEWDRPLRNFSQKKERPLC